MARLSGVTDRGRRPDGTLIVSLDNERDNPMGGIVKIWFAYSTAPSIGVQILRFQSQPRFWPRPYKGEADAVNVPQLFKTGTSKVMARTSASKNTGHPSGGLFHCTGLRVD